MIYTPVNAITWTVGCLPMFVNAFRSWKSYMLTKNPIAQIYVWLGLTLGVALFFFGVPALFTENTQILKYTYFSADAFIQLSIQVQAWLLWFIGLRNHVQLKTMLIVAFTFSTVLIALETLTSSVSISHSPHLVVYSDQWPVLAMKSIIYVIIPIPLGYFFLRQVSSQTTAKAKLKMLAIGGIFIVLALAATLNNIFDKGSDTVQSAVMLGVVFVILLIVLLLPRAKQGVQPKPIAETYQRFPK